VQTTCAALHVTCLPAPVCVVSTPHRFWAKVRCCMLWLDSCRPTDAEIVLWRVLTFGVATHCTEAATFSVQHLLILPLIQRYLPCILFQFCYVLSPLMQPSHTWAKPPGHKPAGVLRLPRARSHHPRFRLQQRPWAETASLFHLHPTVPCTCSTHSAARP
jgi:hypothetical protein